MFANRRREPLSGTEGIVDETKQGLKTSSMKAGLAEVNRRPNKSPWWHLSFGRYLTGETGREGTRLDADLPSLTLAVADFR